MKLDQLCKLVDASNSVFLFTGDAHLRPTTFYHVRSVGASYAAGAIQSSCCLEGGAVQDLNQMHARNRHAQDRRPRLSSHSNGVGDVCREEFKGPRRRALHGRACSLNTMLDASEIMLRTLPDPTGGRVQVNRIIFNPHEGTPVHCILLEKTRLNSVRIQPPATLMHVRLLSGDAVLTCLALHRRLLQCLGQVTSVAVRRVGRRGCAPPCWCPEVLK
jgi:hypothetical protein